MGSEGDARVKAAKDSLQSRLKDVFDKTLYDCHNRLLEFEYPFSTGAGDSVVRDAIDDWRAKSLECITKGFESFLAVTRGNARADIARSLTWEAIDQAFNWTGEDRGNSTRFEEWLTEATSMDIVWVYGLRMVSLECNVQNVPQTVQLNCDFRTQFERLLDQLRNEAFSNIPTAQSTKPADSLDASGIQNGFTHSDDYRSVTARDKHYTLTPNQARIIQTLDEAAARGIYAVSTAALRKSIGGTQSRIRDSFRSGDGRKFWEEFVVQTGRGMYVLKLPPRH
jgi:hypothetical protein